MSKLMVRHTRSGLRAGLCPNITTSRLKIPLRHISTTSFLQSKEGENSKNVQEWASKEAIEALNLFKERFQSNNGESVSTYYQRCDENQIHLLRTLQANMLPLGLGRENESGMEGLSRLEYEAKLRKDEENILAGQKAELNGTLQNEIRPQTEIIPTEHLAFFTPRVMSSSLGEDGSDTTFNPPGGVFTRRMWAGGQMEWKGKRRICIGDRMWERTFVEEAELKKTSSGGEMLLVWVRKEFGLRKSVPIVIDRRSWIFQRALPERSNVEPQNTSAIKSKPDLSSLTPPEGLLYPTLQYQTPANLFRYSALTYNAHAIHLSPPWAQQVEGHRGTVVHGPLNLSLLVRKWGREIADWHLNERGEFFDGYPRRKRQVLKGINYRAKSPICAEEPYWIGIQQSNEQSNEKQDSKNEQKDKVVALKPDGQVIMEATITSMSEFRKKNDP